MRRYGTPATARASFYVYNTDRGGRPLGPRRSHRAGDIFAVLEGSDARREHDVALDDIYKEVILDHYKNPRNKRDLPGAARSSCTRGTTRCRGDEITDVRSRR
jgi:hypothetical protein